jgi:hypothetical protein
MVKHQEASPWRDFILYLFFNLFCTHWDHAPRSNRY